mmetsp:Transcript_2754/g.4718  ORF Transcript_2754/g.4718 Transcript_2754/m.4718 type:complete len:194 (+) Transcript_2754:408-989(+)
MRQHAKTSDYTKASNPSCYPVFLFGVMANQMKKMDNAQHKDKKKPKPHETGQKNNESLYWVRYKRMPFLSRVKAAKERFTVISGGISLIPFSQHKQQCVSSQTRMGLCLSTTNRHPFQRESLDDIPPLCRTVSLAQCQHKHPVHWRKLEFHPRFPRQPLFGLRPHKRLPTCTEPCWLSTGNPSWTTPKECLHR